MKTQQEAIERAKENPEVIILDLNTNNVEPFEVIEKLKADEETSKINLLGYVSHVQADLKLAAQEKGCDMVLARSAFSQNLAPILRRYAEPVYVANRVTEYEANRLTSLAEFPSPRLQCRLGRAGVFVFFRSTAGPIDHSAIDNIVLPNSECHRQFGL